MIISAFPGTGKSKLFQLNPAIYSDSDSSKFDKKSFPSNYIGHIKDLLSKKKYILVSSHIEVRKALVAENIPFIYVYPSIDRKEEFLYNYKQRGSSDVFVNNVKDNWDRWLIFSSQENKYPTYVLTSGFVSTKFDEIVKAYEDFYKVGK